MMQTLDYLKNLGYLGLSPFKSVALLTSIIFTISTAIWAQPPSPLPPTEKPVPVAISSPIHIPEAMGIVQKEYRASPSSPFIILIQDAHAIQDAQRNIQKLIGYFQEKYGIRLVALEGGSGRLDPTLFRVFPDEEIRQKIFAGYLEQGELTGAEMAAIFNPEEAEYYGIEDWGLYEVSSMIQEEVDFEREKANAERMSENYERSLKRPGKSWTALLLNFFLKIFGRFTIYFPKAEEVKQGVLIREEHVPGVSLKDYRGKDKWKIQVLLLLEVLRQIFDDGFYHTDLHPG